MTTNPLLGQSDGGPRCPCCGAAGASLLEVTPAIEEHGYDWQQIDALLFDPDVQTAIHRGLQHV